MTDADLLDFIQCYHPENRHERTETWSEENLDGRWRKFIENLQSAMDNFNELMAVLKK